MFTTINPWAVSYIAIVSLLILPPFHAIPRSLEGASERTLAGPDALLDVTNGMRWASNPGPCWSESSALTLGHGCSILL